MIIQNFKLKKIIYKNKSIMKNFYDEYLNKFDNDFED